MSSGLSLHICLNTGLLGPQLGGAGRQGWPVQSEGPGPVASLCPVTLGDLAHLQGLGFFIS